MQYDNTTDINTTDTNTTDTKALESSPVPGHQARADLAVVGFLARYSSRGTIDAYALDTLVFESINGGTTWFGSLVGASFA